MATMNTHHTLNDDRLAPESLNSGSHSGRNVGAGAVVLAIFLGVGAYFFYTSHQGQNVAAPATETSQSTTDTMTETTLPASVSGAEQPAPAAQPDAMNDANTAESNAAATAQ